MDTAYAHLNLMNNGEITNNTWQHDSYLGTVNKLKMHKKHL